MCKGLGNSLHHPCLAWVLKVPPWFAVEIPHELFPPCSRGGSFCSHSVEQHSCPGTQTQRPHARAAARQPSASTPQPVSSPDDGHPPTSSLPSCGAIDHQQVTMPPENVVLDSPARSSMLILAPSRIARTAQTMLDPTFSSQEFQRQRLRSSMTCSAIRRRSSDRQPQ